MYQIISILIAGLAPADASLSIVGRLLILRRLLTNGTVDSECE